MSAGQGFASAKHGETKRQGRGTILRPSNRTPGGTRVAPGCKKKRSLAFHDVVLGSSENSEIFFCRFLPSADYELWCQDYECVRIVTIFGAAGNRSSCGVWGQNGLFARAKKKRGFAQRVIPPMYKFRNVFSLFYAKSETKEQTRANGTGSRQQVAGNLLPALLPFHVA